MPSKIQLDENLWFLYICLLKSDLKTIDFTAVGLSTNLKPPAARMRYTRLRRQIESGTLIGTHGTPFSGSADKIYEASTKRKRGINIKKSRDDDTEDDESLQSRARARSGVDCKGKSGGSGNGKDSEKGKGKEKLVKVKDEPESDFSSTSSDFEDSEDEMPLAKLRKARLGPFHSSNKPYTSPYSNTYANGKMTPITGAKAVPRSMAGFGHGMGGEWTNALPLRFNGHQLSGVKGGGVAGGWQNVESAKFQGEMGCGTGMKRSP